jgi:hypothetical protein
MLTYLGIRPRIYPRGQTVEFTRQQVMVAQGIGQQIYALHRRDKVDGLRRGLYTCFARGLIDIAY